MRWSMRRFGNVTLVVSILGFVAFAFWSAWQHVHADRAVVEAMSEMRTRIDAMGISPAEDMPVVMQQEYVVRCGTVDGGAAADLCVPFDGGTAGIGINATSFYVAPITGASIKVRVGTKSVTSKKGMEIGPSARDGVGTSLNVLGCNIGCASEGAAQDVDVVAGRRP